MAKYRVRHGVELEAQFVQVGKDRIAVVNRSDDGNRLVEAMFDSTFKAIFELADAPSDTVEVKKTDLRLVLDYYARFPVVVYDGQPLDCSLGKLRSALGEPEKPCNHAYWKWLDKGASYRQECNVCGMVRILGEWYTTEASK